MKRAVVLVLLCVAVTSAVAQPAPTIAVLDFAANTLETREMRSIITYLSSELFQTGNYRVIEIAERERLLEEVEFSLSAASDISSQLNVGKLISADIIVVGDIGRIGSRYLFTVKCIQTETAAVLSTANGTYQSLDALIDDLRAIALTLSGSITPRAVADSTNQVSPSKSAAPSPSPQADADSKVQRLKAPVSGDFPHFGSCLALSGDYLIIGAPKMEGESGSGAACIYERSAGGIWSLVQTVRSPEPENGDGFGASVSISGEYAIIGAPEKGRGLLRKHVGAAYVFRRVGERNWQHCETILSTSMLRDALEYFGHSISMNAGYVVIADNNRLRLEKLHIFERIGATKWGNGCYFELSKGSVISDIAISDKYLFRGSHYESSTARNGAVFCYWRSGPGNRWSENFTLRAPTPRDRDLFGHVLAFDQSRLIVGSEDRVYVYNAQKEWTLEGVIDIQSELKKWMLSALAISGDRLLLGFRLRSTESDGKAVLYRRTTQGSWEMLAVIQPSTDEEKGDFGSSVAIDQEVIIIGDPGAPSGGVVYSLNLADIR